MKKTHSNIPNNLFYIYLNFLPTSKNSTNECFGYKVIVIHKNVGIEKNSLG